MVVRSPIGTAGVRGGGSDKTVWMESWRKVVYRGWAFEVTWYRRRKMAVTIWPHLPILRSRSLIGLFLSIPRADVRVHLLSNSCYRRRDNRSVASKYLFHQAAMFFHLYAIKARTFGTITREIKLVEKKIRPANEVEKRFERGGGGGLRLPAQHTEV